jgi:WG containing repeat
MNLNIEMRKRVIYFELILFIVGCILMNQNVYAQKIYKLPFKENNYHLEQFHDGYCAVIQGRDWGCVDQGKNKKTGFINSIGQLVIPYKYDDVKEFIDGQCVVIKNNKYGLIDSLGNEILPIIHDYMYLGRRGVLRIDLNNKEKYFYKNSYIGVGKFDEVKNLYYNPGGALKKFYIAIKNDKKGIIDIYGNIIIPLCYDDIESLDRTSLFNLNYSQTI